MDDLICEKCRIPFNTNKKRYFYKFKMIFIKVFCCKWCCRNFLIDEQIKLPVKVKRVDLRQKKEVEVTIFEEVGRDEF